MTNENTNFHMLLRLAVRNCMEEDFSEFQSMDASDVTVHPRIRRKVKAAVHRMYLRTSMGWQIMKRSIAACLVIVTVLFASAMCIQPIRSAFWNAVVTWYEEYIEILFVSEDDEYPTIIEEQRLPQVPAGWTMTEIEKSDAHCFYEIMGPDNEYIVYEQRVYTEISQGYDNTECDIQEIILNNETKAQLITYKEDEIRIITWLNQYEYSLIGEFVTVEQLISIAESVK